MSNITSNLASGHGIQVLSEKFTLDEEALETLLNREDIGDLPVVVLSVAGGFRKGKSFLLNFFLRYLNYKYNLKKDGDQWLGAEDEKLTGFKWQSGCEPHTKGLWLWSQPFIATTKKNKKVVILLMDTQGTFDSESTTRENAIVFALSALISSVMIYNLSQNIYENDLEHLELFTEYGRLAKEDRKENIKPFQHLQFLVRDWECPYNHDYGIVGGNQLLQKRLEIRQGQHPDLQALRLNIRAYFENITSFLMPHPGRKVATKKEFEGKFSDIDEEFKIYLKELAPSLLAPESLIPKVINDQPVTVNQLLTYFKTYMGTFNSNKLPVPKTMLAASAEFNNLVAVDEGRKTYNMQMRDIRYVDVHYLPPKQLQQKHRSAKDKALDVFNNIIKFGPPELENKYRQQLKEEVDALFEQFCALNESKPKPWNVGISHGLAMLVLLGIVINLVGSIFGIMLLVIIGCTIWILALGSLGLRFLKRFYDKVVRPVTQQRWFTAAASETT